MFDNNLMLEYLAFWKSSLSLAASVEPGLSCPPPILPRFRILSWTWDNCSWYHSSALWTICRPLINPSRSSSIAFIFFNCMIKCELTNIDIRMVNWHSPSRSQFRFVMCVFLSGIPFSWVVSSRYCCHCWRPPPRPRPRLRRPTSCCRWRMSSGVSEARAAQPPVPGSSRAEAAGSGSWCSAACGAGTRGNCCLQPRMENPEI